MHFRRIIKIILILLAVFFILLVGLWFLGRNTAKKNGKTPLSFRQFLGLGTTAQQGNAVPGAGSALFTNPNTGTTDTSNSGNNSTNGSLNTNLNTSATLNTPTVSQFTGVGISPTLSGGIDNNQGSYSGSGNGGNSNNSNTNSSNTTAATTSTSAPACGDADTNIDFTPEEIAKLNELQNRFYTIAQNLHTDADVDTEQANHDAFAVKADQITEMYNYCKNEIPAIAASTNDPRLNLRVATPFWRDATTDNISMLDYYSASGLNAAHLEQVHDTNAIDPEIPDTSGIQGPYGGLNLGAPNSVPINGSIVKTNSITTASGPFGLGPTKQVAAGSPGATTTTTGPDFGLLVPVVEKILRINLW